MLLHQRQNPQKSLPLHHIDWKSTWSKYTDCSVCTLIRILYECNLWIYLPIHRSTFVTNVAQKYAPLPTVAYTFVNHEIHISRSKHTSTHIILTYFVSDFIELNSDLSTWVLFCVRYSALAGGMSKQLFAYVWKKNGKLFQCQM